MSKKVLFIPIETKVREYHAMLLLAIHAVQRDYQVIIGSRRQMYGLLSHLPPVIYIGKHIHPEVRKLYQWLKRMGHKIISFDEEGLVCIPDKYKRYRVDREALSTISHFFAWGEFHSSLVREVETNLTNCSTVGNMRFELLKSKYHGIYETQINTLKKKYGEYILFNTNFGRFNHVKGFEASYEQFKNTFDTFSAEDESFYKARYEFQEEIFKSFQSLIAYLAPKIKPINIVIRPHPVENINSWETMSAPNVFIETKGNVIPWILGAKAIVHNNCTTAVESVFLGTPVITYSPKQDSNHDVYITNNVGKICRTKEDVTIALAQQSAAHTQLDLDESFLEKFVSNMHPEENVAHEVLDVLDNIDIPAAGNITSIHEIIKYRKQKQWGKALRSIKKFVKTILGYRANQNIGKDYNAHKFPGLKKDELLDDIRLLSQVVGVSPDTITATQLVDNVFHVTVN